MRHGEHCEHSGQWYKFPECREFSTDGTSLGAAIAHAFGTTDENEILRMGAERHRQRIEASLTGMEAEQADWESEN